MSNGQRGVVRKLRHNGKTRHAKGYIETSGKICISHLIEERPASANNRDRIDDWEADTVAGQTGKACLVTLTDRKSRFLLYEKADKKESRAVSDKMIQMFRGNYLFTKFHQKEHHIRREHCQLEPT